MSVVEAAAAALRAGRLVLLPTDTVYGLACAAESEQAARALYALKGRDAVQPTAVVFASVDVLLERVPGLDEAAAAAVRELLPGPYTLVLPNPTRQYPWLNSARPEAIGVRVPKLPPGAAAAVAAVGAVVATSANLPGGVDPCRLEDVPDGIRDGVAAAIDGGVLPGTPSTVIDVTGAEPTVLRRGAGDPDGALERVAAARG